MTRHSWLRRGAALAWGQGGQSSPLIPLWLMALCAGFMALGDCEAAIGQEVNIATGEEHSIGDLANELIRQINPEAKIVCDEQRLRPENSEVNRLLGDASKMRALTGWKPAYTFEQGLAATIEFLRGNMERYKPDVYNL